MPPVQTQSVPLYSTVTSTSAQFDVTLDAGKRYVILSSTAAWVLFHATAATAVLRTAGNHYVAPNVPFEFFCQVGITKVAIVRDAADGHASLSLA